jgi:hypothetical protein
MLIEAANKLDQFGPWTSRKLQSNFKVRGFYETQFETAEALTD